VAADKVASSSKFRLLSKLFILDVYGLHLRFMKFSRKTKASLEAALTCAISQSDFAHHNASNHCNIGLLTRTCEQFFNFQAVSNQAIQKIRVEVFFF
jgi:hypothetical protein